MKESYKHREAFCLMKYANKERTLVELLWNSRDGVTPFGIRSRDGAQEMLHVDWAQDRRDPWHTPRIGDRIFVDLTMERALEFATKRVEHFWDNPEYPMREHYEGQTKEQVARQLAHASMRQGIDDLNAKELLEYGAGPPDVIVVTEEVLAALVHRRPPANTVAGRRFA